jgi:multiple sugar transport system permease protein
MRGRDRIIAFTFIAPATALIAMFVLWPVVSCFITAAHEAPLSRTELGDYTGLRNLRVLLEDVSFRRSVRNTVYFTVLVVPLQTILALLLALWTNGRSWRKRTLRLCVFLPTAFSLTVLSVVWKLMYEPATATGAGLFNGLLLAAGLEPQPFLTSTAQAMPAIVIMSVWQGVGLQMMILLAGLQTVPSRLYEAATIDGAGGLRRFFHVTLPGVAPTLAFVVMITTIFALKFFVQPFIMTRGGPQGATISIVQYVYEAAFRQRDLGLACAAGVVFFIIVSGITGVLHWLVRRAEALS